MSTVSTTVEEQKKVAVQLLVMGRSYRQIGSILGVSKSLISKWVNSDKSFQEALEAARATQNENQAEVLDAYKMALFRAAEEAGNSINTLVALANNPESRGADRLKAIEMLFGRADKLMAFLEHEARFPQEVAIAKQRELEREKIWKLELEASGWKESYPLSGCWFSPIDGVGHDIEAAYRLLQSNPSVQVSKMETLNSRLIDAVTQILEKIARKATQKDISLEEGKQLSTILRNLKAAASSNDAAAALSKLVDWELIPSEALSPLIDACDEGDSFTRARIREILKFERF